MLEAMPPVDRPEGRSEPKPQEHDNAIHGAGESQQGL
jgi:hypothetical protein